jgi:hypothetical protein
MIGPNPTTQVIGGILRDLGHPPLRQIGIVIRHRRGLEQIRKQKQGRKTSQFASQSTRATSAENQRPDPPAK